MALSRRSSAPRSARTVLVPNTAPAVPCSVRAVAELGSSAAVSRNVSSRSWMRPDSFLQSNLSSEGPS